MHVVRDQRIIKVLFVIFLINIAVTAIKIILGIQLNLASLLAEGYHSISDSFSNIIGIIGMKLASKQADEKHPYGHQKFESIASMMIGILLLIMGGKIVYEAIMWFFEPTVATVDISSIIALGVTFVLNVFVSVYEYKKGKSLQSEILIADSLHTRSDLLISLGVIGSIILLKFGAPAYLDLVVSCIIALFIFFCSAEILKSTISSLVDQKAVEKQTIEDIVFPCCEEILAIDQIRSRGKMDHIYIELRLYIPASFSLEKVHELEHQLEKELSLQLNKEVELFVHFEPSIEEKHPQTVELVK